MKKQEYIDMGLQAGLSLSQIESVLFRILEISSAQLFVLQEISSRYIYEIQKAFYAIRSGIPQEYILQKANFYGRDFFVDDRVLIPRNDTELLVQKAVKQVFLEPNITKGIYIDVGTGSSCVAVSMILEIAPLRFQKSFALDISREALTVASINIDTFAAGKIDLLQSNLLEEIFSQTQIEGKDIFLTANLPYIKDKDLKNMDKSVFVYEPHRALFGGKSTGFELYQELIKQCFQLKHIFHSPKIHLFIEIGFDQYDVSKKLLQDFGLSFEYFQDSASIYRVIHITGF